MYFDGVVNVCGNGAGVVIISPDKKQYSISIKLQFDCTNTTAEYEACILSLEVALEMNIKNIDVYRDSMLIICQVKGDWQTKEEKLRPYQEYLSKLAREFEEIKFTHLGKGRKPVCRCFGHTSIYGQDRLWAQGIAGTHQYQK